ncbi:MAG TPA: alkaline phosphatase D family protein [Fibrobacteria bacterium]|nr:alkaline phosphatase D family protein [Fibrobacteria bacterium]
MSSKLLLGPLLGCESDTTYTICFLTPGGTPIPDVLVDGRSIKASLIQGTPSGSFWRAEAEMPAVPAGRHVAYSIHSQGQALENPAVPGVVDWKFYVPGKAEEPRIAYASCNGFSDGDMKAKLSDPYAMWKRMAVEHGKDPYALLLMGGDQVYADEIWHSRDRAGLIAEWARGDEKARKATKVGRDIRDQLDKFYEGLYLRHWAQPDMAAMMASIPSLMMWDDHDIFDGWGSYSDGRETWEVPRAIFAAARRYFELFQVRSAGNRTLLNPKSLSGASGGHYSFGLRFRRYGILGLDNRSQRSLETIMDEAEWADVKQCLEGDLRNADTLLVLSAVPVVYRDFAGVERLLEMKPGQDEMSDDLSDHWRSRHHNGERMKLIQNLLKFQSLGPSRPIKRVILSGDVHVGSLGIIREGERRVYQVVSSGIVHPPPSWLQWLGITTGSNDRPESLDAGKIRIEIAGPYGTADKFLRTRNFASLKEGGDKKLWVTWTCEAGKKAEYPFEGTV